MNDKFNYDVLTLTLDNARDKEKFAIAGEYLYILASTDSNVNIEIVLNSQTEDKIKLQAGKGIIAPFKHFWLSHSAQAGKTITLIASSLEGFRLIDNTSSISSTVATQEIAGGSSLTDVVNIGNSATEIRAAKSTRKDLILFNPSGGSTVYVGEAGVTTGNGFPIEPGTGISFNYDGTALYGIVTAGTQDINVREIW